MSTPSINNLTPGEAFSLTREAADALCANPALGDARAAIGYCTGTEQFDWMGASMARIRFSGGQTAEAPMPGRRSELEQLKDSAYCALLHSGRQHIARVWRGDQPLWQ